MNPAPDPVSRRLGKRVEVCGGEGEEEEGLDCGGQIEAVVILYHL